MSTKTERNEVQQILDRMTSDWVRLSQICRNLPHYEGRRASDEGLYRIHTGLSALDSVAESVEIEAAIAAEQYCGCDEGTRRTADCPTHGGP